MITVRHYHNVKLRITIRTTMFLGWYHARFAGFCGDGTTNARERDEMTNGG
jgi:hypothetical protein